MRVLATVVDGTSVIGTGLGGTGDPGELVVATGGALVRAVVVAAGTCVVPAGKCMVTVAVVDDAPLGAVAAVAVAIIVLVKDSAKDSDASEKDKDSVRVADADGVHEVQFFTSLANAKLLDVHPMAPRSKACRGRRSAVGGFR